VAVGRREEFPSRQEGFLLVTIGVKEPIKRVLKQYEKRNASKHSINKPSGGPLIRDVRVADTRYLEKDLQKRVPEFIVTSSPKRTNQSLSRRKVIVWGGVKFRKKVKRGVFKKGKPFTNNTKSCSMFKYTISNWKEGQRREKGFIRGEEVPKKKGLVRGKSSVKPKGQCLRAYIVLEEGLKMSQG